MQLEYLFVWIWEMPLGCLLDAFGIFIKMVSFIGVFSLHCRSQTEAISSHRKYNPFKSRVIMALYALLSCIMRATALVIYVVLTLGLLDVLRHLQGSQDTSVLD